MISCGAASNAYCSVLMYILDLPPDHSIDATVQIPLSYPSVTVTPVKQEVFHQNKDKREESNDLSY